MKRRPRAPLSSRRRKGFRGYPMATLACYGPDAERASGVAVRYHPPRGEKSLPSSNGGCRKRVTCEPEPDDQRGGPGFHTCARGSHRDYGGSDHRLPARGRRRLSRRRSVARTVRTGRREIDGQVKSFTEGTSARSGFRARSARPPRAQGAKPDRAYLNDTSRASRRRRSRMDRVSPAGSHAMAEAP